MNLFVIGWELDSAMRDRIPALLREMRAIYPYLDIESSYPAGDTAFVAGLHAGKKPAKLRRYVYQTPEETVLYDGVPVVATAEFQAFDAEKLAQHWQSLPQVLEGQFCVARVRHDPASIEIMVDALGMFQLFYCQTQQGVILSNSVELISRIRSRRSLDTVGAMYCLGLGWTAGDRTLRDGIRVFPAGEIWRWKTGCGEPQRKKYFSLEELSRLPQQNFAGREADDLAQALVADLSWPVGL